MLHDRKSNSSSHMPSQRGIALLLVLGTMIVILVIGSVAVFLISRGLNVTMGQTRYENAYEAAVASLEVAVLRADSLNQISIVNDTTETMYIADFESEIHAERLGSVVVSAGGYAIKFARALAGPGATIATGSYRTYLIRAVATGPTSEQVSLEMVKRYSILAE